MLANLGLDRHGVTTRSQRQYRYLQSQEDRLGVLLMKKYQQSTILDKRHAIKIHHNILHKILKNHRLATKRETEGAPTISYY